MKAKFSNSIKSLGGPSFFAGIVILTSMAGLSRLPELRGGFTPQFLGFFYLAGAAYAGVIFRLPSDTIPWRVIWLIAIGARVVLLFTEPTLSDDVYRYIWDGHLFNQGLNPYALPVDSPQLDAYAIPLRDSVNHAWMASPYLPTAQMVFAAVPGNVTAIQITVVIFDLLTGWLLIDLLRKLDKSAKDALIYLWNPLITVEFAHGAHIDAVMVFLLMLTFWLVVKAETTENARYWTASVFSLVLATLTKLLPILVAPLLLRSWGWKRMLLFVGLILLALSFFTNSAGWGLVGPLDGTGVFGALRIYSQWWNFNSGIYHWIEVFISDYPAPGAVPREIVGDRPIQLAKLSIAIFFGGIALYAFWCSLQNDKSPERLFRLSALVIGASLLLTPTVHPWYLTLIIPLIPFLSSQLRWPWVYLSLAVMLSYITYLNPDDFREYTWVRWMEYIPFYILLIWAAIVRSRKLAPSQCLLR